MFYVIVYKNTFDAMAAEKKLKENEIEYKVMPTPTSITQSCGLCTKIEDEKIIDKIKIGSLFEYKGIYIRNDKGYESVV